jgi:putative flippase GtrA
VAVGVHYGVMILLVEAFRLDEVHAAVIGYTIGGFASYSLNRKFTYDTERSHGAAAWRFAVVAGIGLVITWVFMALFNRYLGWHYVLSQLITTAIVMMWSFFAHKYWTFVDPS